jgi:hypothetical protein
VAFEAAFEAAFETELRQSRKPEAKLKGKSQNGATGQFDFAKLGYPALREALDASLEECETHLTKAEIAAAVEELIDSEFSEENGALFLDFALYLSPLDLETPGRPIDRIAKKLVKSTKPLQAAIAHALPSALFSLFEFKEAKPDGAIVVSDLLDGHEFLVMDDELAASGEPGSLFAARLVELGPWHLPFTSTLDLRKSEVVALLVMCSTTDDLADKRGLLEDIVYTCEICELDIVRAALDPLVDGLSHMLDSSPQDVQFFVEQFATMIPKEDDEPEDS